MHFGRCFEGGLGSANILAGLLGLMIICGIVLSSGVVSADSVTTEDDVSVAVPVSCNLTGIGMNSHNAEIPNGTSNSSIGETTLKAFCNDSEGFAIYAIGYTDDTYGKNVLTNATLGSSSDIATGTGTSGNSQWAMKLSAISGVEPTYPISIQNSFNAFHTVPSEYTMVASRASGTDIGTNAEGSAFTTTYQTYISSTQKAGAYTGKVKYTLVHPSAAPQPVYENQIGVIYDGNGAFFNQAGTKSTNRVIYEASCEQREVTPTIVKTQNIDEYGERIGPYSDDEEVREIVPFSDAVGVKVVVRYGLTADTMGISIIKGEWDGDWEHYGDNEYEEIISSEENLSGTNTYILDTNTVTIYTSSYGSPVANYDYGMYVEVYPIYDFDEPDATVANLCEVDSSPVDGVYATPTVWNGSWYLQYRGKYMNFTSEDEVFDFISRKSSALVGSSVIVYRGLSFNDAFAHADKTQSGGYYTAQDLDGNVCSTVAIGQTITVKDNRDDETYMIRKIKDGNCWFLEDLRLDPTDSSTISKINAGNTNASAAAITNFFNGGNPDNVPGWTSVPMQDVGFEIETDEPYIYKAYKDELVTSYGPAAVNGQAKAGIYYNYCAATVGIYCYPWMYGFDVEGTLVDAPYSLCPVNWRLPNYNELNDLLSIYDATDDLTGANGFYYNLSVAMSGSIGSYGPGGLGYQTYWWSSTYDAFNDSGHMYVLSVEENLVNIINDYPHYGNVMRCVLAP